MKLKTEHTKLLIEYAKLNTLTDELKKKVYGPYDFNYHKDVTWKEYYERGHENTFILEKRLKEEVAIVKDQMKTQRDAFENQIEEERAKWDSLDVKYNNALQEIKSLKGLKTWIIWSSDPNRRRHVEAKTQKEIGDYTVFSIGKEEVFKIKTSLIETIERR